MNEPTDLVNLFIALFAILVSKELALLIGPYAAIVVLACAGAALSLSGTEKELNAWQATWYVSIRVLAAVVLTVSFAELLQNFAPWAKPRYTLIPVAFGIGWIRDFESVRTWFGSVIDRVTSKGIGDGK